MSRGLSFVGQILSVSALSLICLAIVLQLFASAEASMALWIEVMVAIVALTLINVFHVQLAIRWRNLANKESG
jgi:hypothetical protein